MTCNILDIISTLQNKGHFEGIVDCCKNTKIQQDIEDNSSLYDIDIKGTCGDSRNFECKNLFICKGKEFRREYLLSVLNKGCNAFLCDRETFDNIVSHICFANFSNKSICAIVVDDVRNCQSFVSKQAWEITDEDLQIIGITGTKGKTTTTTFVFEILKNYFDAPVGLIGTHKYFDGKVEHESNNTTPEPPELYCYLSKMKEVGCKYCVMEISSQGLKYGRVEDLSLQVGAILNIGEDHISSIEHTSLQDYVESKFKILHISKKIVVNKKLALNNRVEAIIKKYKSKQFSQFDGEIAYFDIPQEKYDIRLKGDFNQQNAECAIKICELMGIDKEYSKNVLKQVRVDGRMQIETSEDKKLVAIVDYAHTYDSFKLFFEEVKQSYPEFLICAIFGVSGGKALNRYSELPECASQFADYIIVTSDEPLSEKPEKVVDALFSNLLDLKNKSKRDFTIEKEVNRNKACKIAFKEVKEMIGQGKYRGAVLCLLGKGDEDTCPCSFGDIKIIPDTKMAKKLIDEYNSDQI